MAAHTTTPASDPLLPAWRRYADLGFGASPTIEMKRTDMGVPRPKFPPALSRTLLFDLREVEAWLKRQRSVA